MSAETPVGSPTEPTASAVDLAWQGIELCRQGDWKQGIYTLSMAASAKEKGVELPSLFYSYLGYGLARFEKQRKEGLQLAKRAIEIEFYQPEAYYFLSETYLLLRDRRNACDIVERGLQVDSDYADLLNVRARLGQRRPSVFAKLPRDHWLNRAFGKLRHRLIEGPASKRKAPIPTGPAWATSKRRRKAKAKPSAKRR